MRIKFYSKYDLSVGNNLKKAENLLRQENIDDQLKDINDYIEIYNIYKFLVNEMYLVEWTENQKKKYLATSRGFISITARFFKKNLSKNNFKEKFKEVERNYQNDFFELVDKFNIYKSIDLSMIEELLDSENEIIYHILKYRNIVKYYDLPIKLFLLNYENSTEILLNKYILEKNSNYNEIFLPKSLNIQDKEKIIKDYIDYDNANYNYLKLITNIQNSKDQLYISDDIRLKASKKIKKEEKKILNKKSNIMKTRIEVSYSEDIDGVEISFNSNLLKGEYDLTWIENNLDYPTLLNNFIYLFHFVDKQMLSTHVSERYDELIFEKFGIKSKKSYSNGFVFEQFQLLSLLQIQSYYNILLSLGVRLENVIEWYFKDYLRNEFEIKNFEIKLPSANSTIQEKCTFVMPALEYVLKAFDCYVKEGNIIKELIQLSSKPLKYENVLSLIDKKYIYGAGKEYIKVSNILFSDQTNLGYIPEQKLEYKTLYDLLNSPNKMKYEYFQEYDQPTISYLINKKYLIKSDDDIIKFNNVANIYVLKDLADNGVISYWNSHPLKKKAIDELLNRRVLKYESTLFSIPEYNYINYLLNKSKYTNGPNLRNKYHHTQPNLSDSEHLRNYMIFLEIFVLTVIKINDEFCTNEDIK